MGSEVGSYNILTVEKDNGLNGIVDWIFLFQ
jgi:hypothetical protein